MWFIILAGLPALLAVLAIVAFFIQPKTITTRDTDRWDNPVGDPHEVRNPGRLGALGVAALATIAALVITALFSVARIEAREVGVETLFGKYERTLQAGWQWQNPFAAVETFDTKLQTTDVQPQVGFKGGGGGNQPATVQWEITSDEAEALWRDFGTFDEVKDRLVIKTTDDSIDRAMKKYAPADTLQEENATELRATVKEDVSKRLAPYGVTVREVLMPTPNFDDKAKEYLDRVQAAQSNLTRSQIEKETAENDAAADKIRNREASPESITLECLDTMRTWNDDNNGQLPAGFQCIPGADSGVALVKPTD